jgi:AraC-like DNA-binding protein
VTAFSAEEARNMNPRQLYLTYRPGPPLDRFVRHIWYWEGDPPPHAKDRILPSGTPSLVINLEEDEIRSYEGANDDQLQRFPGAVLMGAYSRYSVIDTQEQRAVLGVEFHAGGMWPFFNPAAEELHNQHVTLGDVWGSAGDTLRERILAAPTPHARVRLVEAELLVHACRPLNRSAEIDFALARLARPPQDYSIAMLSEHVGLSARRLTRLFALEVGLTPKLYARIKRFERALRLMNSTGSVEWSDLALVCGYFDQSHLIKDCRAISGFTPSELRLRHHYDSHHVAL